MIVAVSCVLELTIARPRLRVFRMDWSLNARNRAAETIAIHNTKGGHHVLTVKRSGTVICLGVMFDTELTVKPQLRAALLEFKKIMKTVATRWVSPELIKAVLEASLHNKVAYRGVLSGWSLNQSIQFDVELGREYIPRTKNIATSQEANISVPESLGGLGFRRLSDIIQERKRAIVDRSLVWRLTP